MMVVENEMKKMEGRKLENEKKNILFWGRGGGRGELEMDFFSISRVNFIIIVSKKIEDWFFFISKVNF